tara:strand:- start:114 stop:719 length:606 start_codon:yes stop_codon:yes gene_type:complete
MISIIDFGISNVGAVYNALSYLNIKCKIISKANELKFSKKFIIPGSGKFGEGMHLLKKKGFVDKLNELILIKKYPILGICLGYHLMLNGSEESRKIKGLGWINGNAIKFSNKKDLPVPHVGWNKINFKKVKLLENVPNNSMFYFDHSYYPKLVENKNLFCRTTYSNEFYSIYEKENIFACQPHPEKSQKYGLELLKNFSKI